VNSDSKKESKIGNLTFNMSVSNRAYNDKFGGLDNLKIAFTNEKYELDAQYQHHLTNDMSRFDGRANDLLAISSNALVSGATYKMGNFNVSSHLFTGSITDESLLDKDPVVSSQFEPVRLGFVNGASIDTGYKNDSNLKVHTYWKTIDTTGWKLAINIPTKELDEPIVDLVIKLVIICVVAVIAGTLIVYFVIKGLTVKLSKLTDFAKNLADGDYTVDSIKVTDVDEIGTLGNSLNDMYSSSKSIIKSIALHSESINTSANMLNNATSELSNKFNLIKVNMSDINEAVMSSSAATQEVNASTEEVNSSASILSEQALRSKNMANEIMVRAKDVEERSKLAYDNAINLSKQYDESLQKSIDNAQIVESIGTLAGIISNIAEQINLLSLNASIEAARAGEQGKGFAVVASEIGKLAGDTTETVTKIQDTVEDVQKAFLKLTEDAKDILGFVNNTVTPDYEEFVKVGKQYGNDASEVDEISSQISEMSATIERTMNEVSIAINNIAESTQVTAASSSDSLRAVEDVSSVVTEVSDMSAKEGDIARQLDEVVGGFKI
jgi:methyl-accepting chemotaxis protein